MLLSTTYLFKAPIPFMHIKQIQLAFKQTYVLLYEWKLPTEEHSIFHVDKHGKIIERYLEGFKIVDFTMINQTTIIVPFGKEGFIVEIDLQKQSTRHIVFQFKLLQLQDISTFFFKETQLLCFAEVAFFHPRPIRKKQFEDKILEVYEEVRLTYFSLPLTSSPEVVAEYLSPPRKIPFS